MIRTRFRLKFLGAAAALTLLAAPALAALPTILDRVPSEATAVLVTKNLDEVDRAISQLLGAVEMPALATPSELLGRIGLREGVDMTKPMAIALMPGDLDAPTPPAIALAPVKDFPAMMEALGAVADGDIYSMQLQTGETIYARQGEGGYAIVSPRREYVNAHSARPGNIEGHEASIGATGARLLERSHVALLLKKPILDLLAERIEEQMAMQAQMMQGMGEEQAAMMETSRLMTERLKSLFRDGRDLVIGAEASAMGLAFDSGMDFAPETKSGQFFRTGGDSSKLLANLPNKPFLFAYAGDYTSAMAQDALAELGEAKVGIMFGMENADLGDLIGLIDGQAGAVYTSPGGIMGGLLANSLAFVKSDQPKELLSEIQKIAQNLGEGEIGTFTYEKNAIEIDGVPVDAWSATLAVDNQADPFTGGMIQQAMMMLFGPGGMGGYYAPGKNGVYQTLSRNSQLLSDAFASEKGGDALSSNRGVFMVAQRLPQSRMLEGYIGVHAILEQGLQAAAMFGMPLQIDIPAQLPPVGVGFAAENAGFHVSAFVPAPVIKTVGAVTTQAQQMFGNGGMDGMDDDEGDDAPPF